LAKFEHRILITEDKDFGEWVFAHGTDGLTIILLRYTKSDIEQVTRHLMTALARLHESPYIKGEYFVVINRSRIRIRGI